MKTIRCKVQGMTCTSCEVLIERKLKNVPGVQKVEVSQAKGEAQIECDDEVKLEQLQYALREKGYALSEDSAANPSFWNNNKERLSEIGSVLVIIIGVYLALKTLNVLPQGYGLGDEVSYGAAFVIGLVAATSTCLAVSGGLLLTISAKYNEKYPHLTGWQRFRPHLSFNIGRILSYTLLGAALGLVGSALTLSTTVTGVITLVASALMIVVGLQLLHIFPWLDKIQLKMPKFLAHKIHDGSEDKPSSVKSFLLGGATFFLPCGFTQALQLYILGKGDALGGALIMLAFTLGTLPALAGIGFFSSFSKGTVQRYFMTFSAVLVIILGIFNISSGLTLTGAALDTFGTGDTAAAAFSGQFVDGKQVIEMSVDGLDYQQCLPSSKECR